MPSQEFKLRDKVKMNQDGAEIVGEVWQKTYTAPIRYGVRANRRDYKDILAKQMEPA